jgi:hypothetical protein
MEFMTGPPMPERVWLVIRNHAEEPPHFEFFGAYSTEEKAVARCREIFDMVAPAEVDFEVPDDVSTWPGAFYPLDPAVHDQGPGPQEDV